VLIAVALPLTNQKTNCIRSSDLIEAQGSRDVIAGLLGS
jgi:hypothetical protein